MYRRHTPKLEEGTAERYGEPLVETCEAVCPREKGSQNKAG